MPSNFYHGSLQAIVLTLRRAGEASTDPPLGFITRLVSCQVTFSARSARLLAAFAPVFGAPFTNAVLWSSDLLFPIIPLPQIFQSRGERTKRKAGMAKGISK